MVSRHSRSVFALFLTATVPTLTAQDKDWLQFRGPGGLGISAEKGLALRWGQQENLVWKTELVGAGTSSPIVVGKRLYLTSYSGYNVPGQAAGNMDDLKRHLVCVELETGKIIWDKEVPSKLPEQATIREGHGYASSTLAADAERLYAFFGKSGAFAFDHEGKQLWQVDLGSELSGWGSSNSPVLFGELVIINASIESNSMVALDRKTGKEVWRAKGINEAWNTPTLVPLAGGKSELVVSVQGKVLGFDPATGKQLWSCASDIQSYMVPSLIAHDGVVYCIGGRTNGALAIRAGGQGDVTAQHRLWTMRKGSNVSSPVYHDEHLYWANDKDGVAFCVEARTGKIVYEERLERSNQVYASVLLADGKLYYLDRGGKTFVVAARPKFEVLAANDLRDRGVFNATPVAARGKMFLRSDKALYCVGKQ